MYDFCFELFFATGFHTLSEAVWQLKAAKRRKRTKHSAARTSPPRSHSPSALEDCVMRVKGGSGGGAGGAGGLPSPYVKWERVRVSLSTRPFLPRAREGGR